MKNIAIPLALLLAATGAPAHAEDFEQHVTADPHGEIAVSNVAGNIDITAWDKPEVEVKAEVSSSQRVQVESDKSHRISIVVKGSDGGGWFGGDHGATLRLRVPSGSEINLSAVSADVHSRGVTGRQLLRTVSGGIEADIADAEVKTVSGDLKLRGSGAPQHIRINTISGDVTRSRGDDCERGSARDAGCRSHDRAAQYLRRNALHRASRPRRQLRGRDDER